MFEGFTQTEFERRFPEPSAGRRAALEAFLNLPLPSPKQEAWRYTELSKFKDAGMQPPGSVSVRQELRNVTQTDAQNGQGKTTDKVDAFIQAFGKVRTFSVPAGKKAEIAFWFEPAHSGAVQNEITVGKGAQLNVFMHYEAKKAVLFGERTAFRIGPGATVNIYRVQRFGPQAFLFSGQILELQADSQANCFHAEIGGRLSRTVAEHRFCGNGAAVPKHHAVMYGANGQHLDLTTVADHQAQGTQSDVMVKGALRSKALAVYRGIIRIGKNAKHTSSFLRDHMLHLDKGVTSQSIPSLFIDNNDVRASHGATVSKLSDDALFYLRARGLPEKKAEKLVVDGFLQEAAAGFPQDLHETIFKAIDAKKINEVKNDVRR